VNTVLGDTWTLLGEAPDWKRLYERREQYKVGTIPRGGIFLTAGADVQILGTELHIWEIHLSSRTTTTKNGKRWATARST
jgi:phage terminase large subunit GpA-like protein